MHSDDLLFISHFSNLVIKGFDIECTLKPDANGKMWPKPTTYIEADIEKFQVPYTGETCWVISRDTYIK